MSREDCRHNRRLASLTLQLADEPSRIVDEGPQRHGRVAKLRVHQKLGQRVALSEATYGAGLALQGHLYWALLYDPLHEHGC